MRPLRVAVFPEANRTRLPGRGLMGEGRSGTDLPPPDGPRGSGGFKADQTDGSWTFSGNAGDGLAESVDRIRRQRLPCRDEARFGQEFRMCLERRNRRAQQAFGFTVSPLVNHEDAEPDARIDRVPVV